MIAQLLRNMSVLLFYYMSFALDLCARTKDLSIQLAIRKTADLLLFLGLII